MTETIPIIIPTKKRKLISFILGWSGICLTVAGVVNLFAKFMPWWMLLIGVVLWISGIVSGTKAEIIEN